MKANVFRIEKYKFFNIIPSNNLVIRVILEGRFIKENLFKSKKFKYLKIIPSNF